MGTASLARELELLQREVAIARELARRRAANPLAHMRWLPAQLAFLRETHRRKLLRAGNQGQGKTTVGAAEALYFALGNHPFQRGLPEPPVYQFAICANEKQARTVQRKVWDLVPKSEVLHGCYFDPRKGAFVGRYPRLLFRNGSWIEFVSGGGDTAKLASETLHRVWFDEPPESPRVWEEAQKRVLRTNGWLAITMTPVNRPVEWLRELATKQPEPLVRDLHFRLEPENLILDNGQVMTLEDGTPMEEAWIAQLRAETSPMEAPVILDGEWEFRLDGAYLSKVWDPDRMVVDRVPGGEYEELLGIDWGDRPGKQIALYIMVDEHGGKGGHPHIHVEDEYVVDTGGETVEDDAEGVVLMLRRNGREWANLKAVKADRTHKAKRPDRKGALEFMAALEDYLGARRGSLHPEVHVAKRGEGRGKGSVGTRSSWLYAQMARGNFSVNKRCKRLIEAIPKYSPIKDNDWKDPIDALVYGCDDYIYRTQRVVSAPVALWGSRGR